MDFILDWGNLTSSSAIVGLSPLCKSNYLPKMEALMVGYETQGPSPSSRAESQARIFEFPIFQN